MCTDNTIGWSVWTTWTECFSPCSSAQSYRYRGRLCCSSPCFGKEREQHTCLCNDAQTSMTSLASMNTTESRSTAVGLHCNLTVIAIAFIAVLLYRLLTWKYDVSVKSKLKK